MNLIKKKKTLFKNSFYLHSDEKEVVSEQYVEIQRLKH